MYSVPGDTTSLVPGFPIRTSSDPRSVDSSPRHNAASHVLHRPLMPRHPPCALKHLQHKKPKEKASPTRGRNLYELKNSEIAHQHTKDTNPRKDQRPLRARCSQPLSTNQTPHPTTKDGATTTTPTKRRTIPGFPHSGRRDSGPVASKPNSVLGSPHHHDHTSRREARSRLGF